MIFIKRLFCKHDYQKEHEIYGDKIIHMGYKRSIWICTKCGKEYWSSYLDKMEK